MSARTKEYPIYPQDATRPLLEKYEFFIMRVRPKITLKTIKKEVGIAPKIVSHLLNGYAELGQPLARSNLIKIIKVLAQRNAIRSRNEAEEFLQLAGEIAGFDGKLSENNKEDKEILEILLMQQTIPTIPPEDREMLLNRIIGREQKIKSILKFLQDDKSPLVTITGTG